MTKYTNEWVLKEYVESLDRMLDATLHQLKQSKKSLEHIKGLIKEEASNG